MHLVADPKAFQAALEKGLPFARTLCGRTVSRRELAALPHMCDCSGCMAQAQASAMAVPEEAPEDSDLDNEISGDLDDDLDGLGDDLNLELDDWDPNNEDMIDDDETGEATSSEEPEDPEDPEPNPLEMISMMLGSLVTDDFEPMENWERWLVPPNKDPAGVLRPEGSRSRKDLRALVPDEDFEFISNLANLASTIKAERLSARLVTVIHNLALKAYETPKAKPKAKKEVAAEAAEAVTSTEG